MSFFDLPVLVQEKIVKNCSYAEMSRLRSVSKRFHILCAEQLNRGYYQLETIVHDLQKQIKSKLPRRESERHKHPLSTKFDIISSLDSRIQWLKLTFTSSIQNSFCCFYPGRLLDEIYSVLRHLKTQQTFSNPRSILQETRDMSSMAIEHFREQIEPQLQQIRFQPLTSFRSNSLAVSSCSNNLSPQPYHRKQSNLALCRQVKTLKNRIYRQNLVITAQKYQMKQYKQLINIRTRAWIDHSRRLKRLEMNTKQTEQLLLDTRKDNDTLLKRFDQFLLLYTTTTANDTSNNEISTPPCTQDSTTTSVKRRKLN